MIKIENIFADAPKNIDGEFVKRVSLSKDITVEGIISSESNVRSEIYDQNEWEFVVLLEGYAKLEFEDGNQVEMRKGDYIHIPPHSKHRILKTDKDTKWLCMFYK